MLTWLPLDKRWQKELMVSSNRASSSSFSLFSRPVWGGRAAVSLAVILFNPLLDVLEGPEGSITKAGTDPEPQGERGEGGALGDPIMHSLSTEGKKQKGSDGRGA